MPIILDLILHGFITGERLNENTLLFKSSSASVTNSLLFTALNVVLVKWLSSQRNMTSSG